MLDTQFPRIAGDIGCRESFRRAPLLKVATGVRVRDIVRPEHAAERTVDVLLSAAMDLEKAGAEILGTSCGFLHGLQPRLAAATHLPMVASSLSLTTRLVRKGHRVGLLTADASALAPAIAAIRVPFIVEGLENSRAFAGAVLADGEDIDALAIQNDTVDAAWRAKARGATCILMECTNLPPYREAVEAETGLPVFDIFDAIEAVCGEKIRA